MLEKRYDINKFFVGNLYFVKNSNKELHFIRPGVFYNVKDGVYIDLETTKTYSCYNDYSCVGEIILDFSNLESLKNVFEENDVEYKKHMSNKEILEKKTSLFNGIKSCKRNSVRVK